MAKHRVFITYHHENDQAYKEALVYFNELNDIFTDLSVGVGDIDESLDNQAIRAKIRDEYLRDSTVTILLVGAETRHRKHVDWELKSSMIDGRLNKRSGIVVINLPVAANTYVTAPHESEKTTLHSHIPSWTSVSSRAEYERRYPYMPALIIDNLINNDAKISVVNWSQVAESPEALALIIDNANAHKLNNEYDLSRTMRRNNG